MSNRRPDGLYAQLKGLGQLPARFPVIPEAAELEFPYRALLYHSHRVIFAVHEVNELVVVHLVYDGARKPLTRINLR